MRGPALAGALLSLALLGGCVPTSAAPDGADAYLDAAAYGQGFLAVGTGGAWT